MLSTGLLPVLMMDDILRAFPKNTESCTKYFGCPYADFCQAWMNPLQRCQEVQPGFKLDFWDPREQLEKANAVFTV